MNIQDGRTSPPQDNIALDIPLASVESDSFPRRTTQNPFGQIDHVAALAASETVVAPRIDVAGGPAILMLRVGAGNLPLGGQPENSKSVLYRDRCFYIVYRRNRFTPFLFRSGQHERSSLGRTPPPFIPPPRRIPQLYSVDLTRARTAGILSVGLGRLKAGCGERFGEMRERATAKNAGRPPNPCRRKHPGRYNLS